VTSFKLGARQLVSPVLLGCLIATALVYLGLAASGDPMSTGELEPFLWATPLSCAVAALTTRGYGVILTDEALVLIGDRRRRIVRTAILRLEVQRTLGVSRVAVYTTDGRRTMLRAPMSFLDREFDRKVQIITEWWQGSR
jgi:hypothetical protein